MNTAKADIISRSDAVAQLRKDEILSSKDALCIKNTTYYVSNDGCDENDGLSPESAIKTLYKVSLLELCEGDGVRFKRGDLFRGVLQTKSGVSYGAYGDGEKPKFYGWDFSLADTDLWELYDAEHNIWKMRKPILDTGTLVFNDGEYHSVKLIPSYIKGRFVCRNDESKLFSMAEQMVRDLDIYWEFDEILTTTPSKGENFPIPDVASPKSLGTLYLRCDRGNPASVFDSIEALPRRNMIYVRQNNDVHIDNLCLKYIGCHAIGSGGQCVKNLTVTNCEIGWIGGAIQHYFGTDPNYPQGGRGTVTRFGNGVEVYGGCDGYKVLGCYIYQVYDAAATHQVTTFGKKYEIKNVLYKHNLIEKCVYGIEYFLEMNNGDTESVMENITIADNIIRLGGYGWGQQRHNTDTPALIKGWSYENRAINFAIKDNVFDRSAYRMLHLVAKEKSSCAELDGNIFIQYPGAMIGQYGANKENEPPILMFDENADRTVREIFGDKNATVITIK